MQPKVYVATWTCLGVTFCTSLLQSSNLYLSLSSKTPLLFFCCTPVQVLPVRSKSQANVPSASEKSKAALQQNEKYNSGALIGCYKQI